MNPPAQPSPPLGPGETHVWKVPLPPTRAELGTLPSLLSDAETRRAARFKFEKDQARFIGCRASLRLLLSRYTSVPTADLTFRHGTQGKPMLAGGSWEFNVSHSRGLALIAISRYNALGIDLERIDPAFPRNEVAPDVLTSEEQRELAALPADDQPTYFFQLWTMKEALLKAVGGGLSLDPRDIRLQLDANLDPKVISAPPDFTNATLHRFSVDPDYASALAVLGSVSQLSFFTL